MKRLRLIGALACAAALLAAVPALAPASVQVGSSGWQWGNPLPQGNTLRSISFAGARRLRGGRLRHAAAHHRRRRDVERAAQRHLHQPAPRSRPSTPDSVFAAGGCVARRSDDGGATFTRVAFTPVESSCKEQFAAGWFINRLTGFLALTDGTILRTDNNGDTFAQKNPLPGTRAPGGRGDARRPALPDRPDRRRRDLGRQDLPHHRRRQLVDPGRRHDPRRALVLLPRREQRLRGRRRLAVPRHQGRRRDLDAEGHRHPADQPALDPVRDAEAVRHDDRAGHGARAHRRRRRHGQARDPLPGPDLRRGLRLAHAHRRGRRDRRDGGLRRRRAELRPDRRAPERDLHAGARRRPERHGVRPGRQRLAGQDDRRRQDVDARQRRDLRGRHRRRLPDGAGGLRAGLVGRPVPHQRRRRDVEDARHRARRRAPSSSPRRRPRRSSSPAPPDCAGRPTAATRSRPSRARTSRRPSSTRSTAPAARSSPRARATCCARPIAARRGRRCTSRP